MNIISLFAGCGGLDLGFEKAGFNVIWANEYDETIHYTYRLNHPNTVLNTCDIRTLTGKDIPDCDGIIGGPPCQAWSEGGKQLGIKDSRGLLFLDFIRIVKDKKPKFFVIENVQGILDNKHKKSLSSFMSLLHDAGYRVTYKLLNAADYKVPQDRFRVFFVGIRSDLKNNYVFPKAVCTTPITLRQAIGDITEQPRNYSENTVEGEHPSRMNHDVYTGAYDAKYMSRNRVRGWDETSFTILAQARNAPQHPQAPKMIFVSSSKRIFARGYEDLYRRLSVRECARIQTFPDSFRFVYKDIKDGYKMVGNAVPPRLAEVLARSILDALNNIKIDPIKLPNRRDLEEYILVGYFKDRWQHSCIIKNKLYYVRCDGRPGSLFKESCKTTPKFLLLHHKEQTEIYELEKEEPAIADKSFLQSLGFKCTGNKYLIFRIKDTTTIDMGKVVYSLNNYSPYFTKVKELMVTQ